MLGKMHIGMLAMWRYDDVSDLHVPDLECSGCGIVGMWHVWDMGY